MKISNLHDMFGLGLFQDLYIGKKKLLRAILNIEDPIKKNKVIEKFFAVLSSEKKESKHYSRYQKLITATLHYIHKHPKIQNSHTAIEQFVKKYVFKKIQVNQVDLAQYTENKKSLQKRLSIVQSKVDGKCGSFPNKIAHNIDAHEIKIEDHVQLVLAACPKNNEVSNFWNTLIDTYILHPEKSCPAWFSFNELTEKSITPFWKKKTLSTLQLPEGVTITQTSKEVIAQDKKNRNENNKVPSLIKRTFTISNTKSSQTFTHYHYKNWVDGKVAPSEEILQKCLRLAMQHLEDPTAYVGINCKHGKGRTGTLANSICVAREIQKMQREASSLSEVEISPLDIYETLRSLRPKILRRASQFTQSLRTAFAVLEGGV